MATGKESSDIKYRVEIDGLRAIAVICVILHHAEFMFFEQDWFQGGFIGVDVFFVISGYLITRILMTQQIERGSINFRDFYERRARRILPALFTVIIVSLPLAIKYLLPSDFVEYSKSILSAVFFGSNFFFYYEGVIYESGNALLKPFLHTWSLGIEEQFYIIFPALLFLLYKYFRQYELFLLVALLLLSFLFAVYIADKDMSFGFYWPASRFWELLAGSALAHIECVRGRFNNTLTNQVLPGVGLCLILYSALSFNENTIHPGLMTVVPIIGASLYISFSNGKDLISKLLSTRLFVAIGLLSYSLYLWHFPIFAFLRIGGEALTNSDKLIAIGCIIGLSVITYYLVERPFRNHKTVPQKQMIVILSILFLSIISVQWLVIKSDGYPNRFSRVEGLLNFERDNKKLRTEAGELAIAKRKTGFEPNGKKALVVGNSHGMDLFNTLYQNKAIYRGYDFYWQAFKLSCLDEANTNNNNQIKNLYNSKVYKDSDVVLISTRFNHAHCNESSDTDGLPYLIQRALHDNKGVIVFGNTTEFAHINNKIIVDHSFYRAEKNRSLSTIITDKDDYTQFSNDINLQYFVNKDRMETLNQEIKTIAAKYNVPYVDKFDMLCSESDEICFGLTPNGYKTFYDYGHYTLEGAKYFGERMYEQGMYDLLKSVTPD